VKKNCSGKIWGDYLYRPCSSTGSLEHDGHWWCKKHHPPSVAARGEARQAKYEAQWAEQDKQRAAAKREQALKDTALSWARRYFPIVVKQWEEEL